MFEPLRFCSFCAADIDGLENVRRQACIEQTRLQGLQHAMPDRFWKRQIKEQLKLQKAAQTALDYAEGIRNANTPAELAPYIREALFLAGA